ncbi:uncharacterized protein LOC100893246 [Strongylocentrotus purpuratus]|uniref:Netrin receptor UNC5 n=1 Tax=Strongylocentrotus purpuratus TaxID=7668 RepID=A0A7M7PCZ4_STRPU|nr:uncharacterized protein LOC100893246 [Strongylocentrotus purpuratus]
MLVGQERVGKTSLKKTLTRQGFDENEAITDGVEATDACEISIEVAKAGEKMWSIHKKGHENEDNKEDEYKKALADDIAKRLTVNPQQGQGSFEPHSRGLNQEEEDESVFDSVEAPKAEVKGENMPNRIASLVRKMLKKLVHRKDQETLEPHRGLNPSEAEEFVLDNVEVPTAKKEDDNMPNQIASLVEEMLKEQVHLKEIGADRTDSGRGEGVSLSIWDFAGHDIYYSTHQVFLTWRAIYVIVFDLSRSLDSVVPPESRDKNYEMVKGGAKSELTCLEFINFWLYSIYAHAVAPSSVINKNSRSKTAQKSPPIFIVGTHRESVKGDAKEKREKIGSAFKKIRESIMERPFQCHVVPEYYAIENSLKDKDDMLVALRRHIERVAMTEPYMGEEIPLRWLLFEEALAAHEINYMSLDQTKELTQSFGMELEHELLTMLTFYHDLGNVVYYGGIEDQHSLLQDMVILNPQWLIDVFKQVITILDPAKRDGIVSAALATLEKDGILEDRLIQHMWQGFLEKKEALVELMAKFDLICEAPVERLQQDGVDTEVSNETEKVVKKRYYVPSRLTSPCPSEEIAQITSSTDFYVDFRGFLPDGLFHRLMARAVRWMGERDGGPVTLFHRHISLMVDGVHHALIEMLPPCEATIKVIVYQGAVAGSDHDGDSHKPPAPSAVKEVMDFVTKTLDSLIQHWARRIEYDVRFLCPSPKCKSKILLKDCYKGMSLKCRLHTIPTAAIKFKFGMSEEGVKTGNESSSSSLQRNEDARRTGESTQRSAPSYQTSRSATSGSSQGQPKFHDIYLKFSQDTDDVHKVKDIIRRNGWTMVTAADSRLGVPKMASIEDALKTCSHVVLIITKEDCEKNDPYQTMMMGMAFQSTVGGSLNGRVISIRCCEESHLPLSLQSLENACINDHSLEDKLKRTIDVSIRKNKERSSVGTSSTLPTGVSIAPPVSSDLSTQPLAAARVASEVERILPRINDLPAVPSSSVNIHGNVFNIGSMYVTGRHDLVPLHPMIIPLVVRHELSKLLNGPRVTHDDWKGLASALRLDDYIASLTNKPDPTADLIDMAERQKKICSLEDLRLILKQMKRDDCVDVLDAGASVESNSRLMIKDRDRSSSSSDDSYNE